MAEKKRRVKINLPDGVDPKPYRNYEKWSHRRWAWEFLRRNESFRSQTAELSDQDEIREEQIRKLKIEFSLWRYKHPDEKYRKPKLPKFSIFRKVVNLNNDLPERKLSATLRPGQLIIAFSIKKIEINRKYISQQSKAVKVALENAYEKYYKKSVPRPTKLNTKNTSMSNSKKLKYWRALRVWDMRNSELSQQKKCELLDFPNPKTIDYNQKISSITKDAKDLIQGLKYVDILIDASHCAYPAAKNR